MDLPNVETWHLRAYILGRMLCFLAEPVTLHGNQMYVNIQGELDLPNWQCSAAQQAGCLSQASLPPSFPPSPPCLLDNVDMAGGGRVAKRVK
jgi:hypothetical protein